MNTKEILKHIIEEAENIQGSTEALYSINKREYIESIIESNRRISMLLKQYVISAILDGE